MTDEPPAWVANPPTTSMPYEQARVAPQAFVYRLWDEYDNCLYVGQHYGVHPAVRVSDHKRSAWWSEVASYDYVTVDDPERLNDAEWCMIHMLQPKHNLARPVVTPTQDHHTPA